MTAEARTRALARGRGTGPALVLDEPLSLWGGVDPVTGSITDRRHPQAGRTVSGTVLVMAAGRGSSSSSSVLAECVRAGTAPAAILLGEPDAILAIGSVVAAELYGIGVPVVSIDPATFERIRNGDVLTVEAGTDGRAAVTVG